MKFRKYSGEINSRMAAVGFCSILFSSMFLPLEIEYIESLLMGVFSIAFVLIISLTSLMRLIRLDKAKISDMIVLSDEAVELQCKNGDSKLILFQDVARIEKIRCRSLSPCIIVTGTDGSKICWYSANEDAKKYILRVRPEMEKAVIERIG